LSEEYSFSIHGTLLNDEYSFLYIQIFECKNKTGGIPCRPKPELDDILAGVFFTFSHTDITIDCSNYTIPNRVYAGDLYTTVSNRYFKEIHHYVKQVTVNTDKGWLLADKSNDVYLMDDLIKEMNDF
jgi:hypothetical protein